MPKSNSADSSLSRKPSNQNTDEKQAKPTGIHTSHGQAQYWQEAREKLTDAPSDSPINIGYECTHRQLLRLRGSKTAILWQGMSGEMESFTYGDLTAKANAFAHGLDRLGIKQGDRVFCLLGRVPELYFACLGSLMREAMFCPLFSAFGPDPIQTRMNIGQARVLVTTEKLLAKKFPGGKTEIAAVLPSLEHIILVRSDTPSLSAEALQSSPKKPSESTKTLQIHEYHTLMSNIPTLMELPTTAPRTPALIHFTSGTTGTPKGAVHVHEAVICHQDTARSALGLTADDIYWCTADPGWVTGTSYGIFAPLSIGATMVVTEREFDPDYWYHTLEEQRVSVWYTAPTALRMLMKAGDDKPKTYDLSRLRHIASVGEPLNAEVVHWGQRVLGKDIHDTWWQTETGCIMIANRPGEPLKPGAMGRALPGMEAAVAKSTAANGTTTDFAWVKDPSEIGELILKTPWPSLFMTYLGEETRYHRCFHEDWYFTGDLVRWDKDGYFWFVGRRDDVIKSSGHLIGPFEIESILLEHEGVAEAGVIGIPDDTLGEVIKAFLSLKHDYTPSDTLQRSILAHARKRLGAAASPREIAFVPSLPKTRSGKVMRRLLKARELGLPEGDISTLETM